MVTAIKSTPRLRRIDPTIFKYLEVCMDKKVDVSPTVMDYLEIYMHNREKQLKERALLKNPELLKEDAEKILTAGQKLHSTKIIEFGYKLVELAQQFGPVQSKPAEKVHSLKSQIESLKEEIKKGKKQK